MIDTIIFIVKMLIAFLPFAILCFFNRKANLPKIDRSKQFMMPVIALVYVTVAMSLLNWINEWLIKLIEAIPRWISSVADISWMPQVVGSVFEKVGGFLEKVIGWLNLSFWIFFISNAVIILVYLIIKKIAIGIISKTVKMDGKIHTKIAGIFYEYFSDKNKWCIKENYVQARSLLKVFYYSAAILSALLMFVSHSLYSYGLIESIFYPVFGIIVVGELYFYLDGTTNREYSGDILGEDEDAYKTVNYSLLRKFLRSVFGDKLLAENTSINNALASDITTDEIIGELEKSEDQKVVTFASYIDALNRTGFELDHNYVHSSLDMLNGKSVLFNNPFYNDLIPYAFYPMNRALLSHQKVLVVLGRHSIEDDIKEWLEKGIESVTNIPFMWNIGKLSAEYQDLDIGIVTRSDVLDIELHNTNAEFLENVGFFVIIEPSKLISTAQIGLNLLVKKCKKDDEKNIVYCMCDKNCDGLVDAMSHVLMTSITEVSATKKHLGTSSYMCWETDEDYLHHRLVPNISRYLGVGTELSFAALKNQVSKTQWYGGEAFPVTDIRWIDKQYYYDLTKYANLPTSQEAMDEYFTTSPNFWSAKVNKNSYITVEDESHNMFEILRDFSTRTTEQGFINIISTEYLLKDYMADNASIFEADAKAIPCIVADYTRSNRNTILRLVLMMSTYPVTSEILEKELSLMGIQVFDLKKQIWYEIYNCYSEVSKTIGWPEDYKQAVRTLYGETLEIDGVEISRNIIKVEERFNLVLGKTETVYSIVDSKFLNLCVKELRSAGYVAEDEKGQRNYLGAELCGHIYQKYLPGQFFTFGGKYYEMQYLTADGQVLVRRAADHINSRPTYRQIRNYTITGIKPSEKIGAQQNIAGMKVVKEFADICVETPGYYKMERYNDFSTAKHVSFEGNGIPKRVYRNKEIIRIELPDFDGKLNDNIRYTIAVLFNEIFKTIFAENQAFICALTDDSFVGESEEIGPLTYSIKADGCELLKNAIYIIEDSQLDLGLTVAVERNIHRIFSIMHDYLDWHVQCLEESLVPPPEPKPPIVFTDTEEEKPEKKGFFAAIGRGIKKIFNKIKGWFKRKPKDGEEPAPEVPTDDGTPKVPEDEQIPTGTPENTEQNPETEGTPENENGDIPDTEEEEPQKKGIFGWFKRKKRKKKEVVPEGPEIPELPEGEPAPVEIPEDAEHTPETEGTPENTQLPPENVVAPENETPVVPENETEGAPAVVEEEPKKKGIFGWFKRKKRKNKQVAPINGELPNDDEPAIPESVAEEIADAENGLQETETGVAKETAELTEAPADDEVMSSEGKERAAKIGFSSERKPYHERYYMRYGKDGEHPFVDLLSTLKYLGEMGLQRNQLKQAREGKKIAEFIEATFKPGKPDARYCDFCGTEIYGVEYETLADGRDRCLHCSRTAIKTGEDFRKIFEDVKRNMESFFGIRINAGIKVEMVNSKTLHKRLGKAFVATPGSDGRVLGVAISDKNGYTLLVENGSPRMASMLTMAHELTHIWQYINWNDKAIRKKYGKKMRLEIYEGMAKWVEIQYAYLINEPAVAKREEIITSKRDDEYGYGFLRYRANYPFSLGTVITKRTPFMDIEEPLEKQYCGPFTMAPPEDITDPENPDGDTPPTGGDTPTGGTTVIKGPSERDPKAFNKYAYGLLNEAEKTVYNTLFEAINNFETDLSDLGASVSDAQIAKIVDYIQRDNPGLFWFQHGATYFFDTTTRIVNRLELRYCMTQDEAKQRQAQIDEALSPFLQSVNDSMCDYEVTLRIYENIIKMVDYDTIGLERQKKSDITPEIPDDLRSIYGVFVNKKAVCAGYAKALQYLLNMQGIECTYVTSDTHAWNLIKLEGDYYHMDVTWGDGSDTKQDKPQSQAVNYDCFCITTAELAKLDSHTPESILPLPICTATKCNYHRRHGLYFEKYDFDKLRTIICESVKQGTLDITFKFASPKVFTEAKRQLIDEGKFREAIQFAGLKSNVKLSSSYRYSVKDDRLTIAFFITKL